MRRGLVCVLGLVTACGSPGGGTTNDAPAADAEISDADIDAKDDAADDASPDACVPATELCNGVDDNCNGQVDEDFTDKGDPCMVGIGACQASGTLVCAADGLSLTCNAVAGTATTELCGNNIDEDCDGTPDDGFEMMGMVCSVGVGGCMRSSMWMCSTDQLSLVCPVMAGMPMTELCNGLDDDCDNSFDEAFPTKGMTCDGGDGDLCKEGTWMCTSNGSGVACSDTSSTDVDICDGMDNDCDPSTVDGSADMPVACDSTLDADACNEGLTGCSGGSPTCSDPGNDDTSNDVNNCGACGTVCGTTHTSSVSCAGFACQPICAFGWQSCDNNPTNGCETTRQNTASCFAPTDLGSVDGDDTNAGVTRSGFSGAAYKVNMLENDLGDDNAVGIVTLTNPADARFTVCAYCASCNNARFKCTTPAFGQSGTVALGRADDTFGDDDVLLYIEVTYFSGNSVNASCGNWSLNIHGMDGSDDCTCDGTPNGSSCD